MKIILHALYISEKLQVVHNLNDLPQHCLSAHWPHVACHRLLLTQNGSEARRPPESSEPECLSLRDLDEHCPGMRYR